MNDQGKGQTSVDSWPNQFSLYGKLTYVGPQEKPTPSLVFHEHDAVYDYLIFEDHQQSGSDYGNDLVGNAQTLLISADEKTAILRQLGGLGSPAPTDNPTWAFVLVQPRGVDETASVEWLVDDNFCKRIIAAIRGGLAKNNEAGQAILSRIPI